MAQPTRYSRSYSFTGYQAANPSDPLPGGRVDAEFDAVAVTTDETRLNLGLIQRDDGKLRNHSVHPDAFDGASLLLMGSRNWTPRGTWATATIYAMGDMVETASGTFVSMLAHLSGDFAVDHASGKWLTIREAVSQSGATPFYAPVRVATTENVTLSGLQVIDDVLLNSGDRVLVRKQTAATENGIFLASASGWTRAGDLDQTEEFTPGALVRVNEGSTLSGILFALDVTLPVAIGTTEIEWGVGTSSTITTPQMFGAKGDGVTDDTEAVQAALDRKGKVFLPAGTYSCKTLYIHTGTEFFGVGDESVLRRHDSSVSNFDTPNTSFYQLITSAWAQGTPDVADNKRNMLVRDMKLDGRCGDFGHNNWAHSMVISSASDMAVERVHIYDFRGDGICLASGTSGGTERHNQNIRVRDCIFDGVRWDNRNGIAIIDCDGLLVEGNIFRNIGAPTVGQSVAGIDFEPNNTFAIFRNVIIRGNTFEDISTTNTGGIVMFNSLQLGDNFGNIKIENNKFLRCYRGIQASPVAKDFTSPDDNVVIQGNEFINSFFEDILVGGFKNVRIRDNTCRLEPAHDATYRGGIGIGRSVSGNTRNSINWIIEGNTLEGLRPQFGAMAIYGARGCKIKDNKFLNISGRPVTLVSNATAVGARYLEDIEITGNEERDSTIGFYSDVSSPAEVDRIIRGKFEGNISPARGTVVHGAVHPLPGMPLVSAPTAGTYDVGATFPRTTPSIEYPAHICSVGGTFGTLAGVTADATNGNDTLTNVTASPSGPLREGQYISVGGAAVRRIVAIDWENNTVTLHANYAGSTGTGLAVAWVAPTFASPPTAAPAYFSGSATYDPASIAAGAQETTTVACTGAALGDLAEASFSRSLGGLHLSAYVSAANTVTCVFSNGTGAPIDLASGTLRVKATRP